MPNAPTRLLLLALVPILLIGTAWVTGEPKASAKPSDSNAAYKRIFRRLDADNDGAVTEREYISRTRWPADKARMIWRASDGDGDGKVTEAEYCRNRRVTDKAKEVFSWIDADKDNKLTEKEVLATAKLIFQKMDKDHSGEVNIPEYLGARWEWDVTVDFLNTPRIRESAEPSPGR